MTTLSKASPLLWVLIGFICSSATPALAGSAYVLVPGATNVWSLRGDDGISRGAYVRDSNGSFLTALNLSARFPIELATNDQTLLLNYWEHLTDEQLGKSAALVKAALQHYRGNAVANTPSAPSKSVPISDSAPEGRIVPTAPDFASPNLGHSADENNGEARGVRPIEERACGCSTTRVECNDTPESYGGAEAITFSGQCLIVLKPSVCNARGIRNGEKIKTAEILDAAYPSADTTDAFQECAVRHEFQHACTDGKTELYNQREVLAYRLSLSCLSHYSQELHCAHGGSSDRCARLTLEQKSTEAAHFLNDCYAKGETRSSCLNRCLNSPQWDQQQCRIVDRLYGFKASQSADDKPKQ